MREWYNVLSSRLMNPDHTSGMSAEHRTTDRLQGKQVCLCLLLIMSVYCAVQLVIVLGKQRLCVSSFSLTVSEPSLVGLAVDVVD